MIDSASILFVLFFIVLEVIFIQGKEGNALHFYVFAEVHHLKITVLRVT